MAMNHLNLSHLRGLPALWSGSLCSRQQILSQRTGASRCPAVHSVQMRFRCVSLQRQADWTTKQCFFCRDSGADSQTLHLWAVMFAEKPTSQGND